MPSRLRDAYLSAVVEALLRYAHEGGDLRYRADRDGDDLVIAFILSDNEAYQAKLSQLTEELLSKAGQSAP